MVVLRPLDPGENSCATRRIANDSALIHTQQFLQHMTLHGDYHSTQLMPKCHRQIVNNNNKLSSPNQAGVCQRCNPRRKERKQTANYKRSNIAQIINKCSFIYFFLCILPLINLLSIQYKSHGNYRSTVEHSYIKLTNNHSPGIKWKSYKVMKEYNNSKIMWLFTYKFEGIKT